MENLIIGIIFLGAVAYLGKQLMSHFSPKNVGCAKGCGGACGIDADKKIALDSAEPSKSGV